MPEKISIDNPPQPVNPSPEEVKANPKVEVLPALRGPHRNVHGFADPAIQAKAQANRIHGPGTKIERRGRRKRNLQMYIEDLEARFDLTTGDPAEYLIYLMAVGRDPLLESLLRKERAKELGIAPSEVTLTPDDLVKLVVPLDVRVDAAKAAAPYVRPKLSAIAVQAEVANKDSVVDEAMVKDPAYRDLMERMMSLTAPARAAANNDE